MVSARSAILSASTAAPGSTAREHVNSLSPGVRVGELELNQHKTIEINEQKTTLTLNKCLP